MILFSDMGSIKLAFTTKNAPDNEGSAVQAYVMWTKSHAAIMEAFPEVEKSEFYKLVQLHGIQRFWVSTWLDRFQAAKNIGESTKEVNHCWATMVLVFLDELWPKLDNITLPDLSKLIILHGLTNRIKGAKFHGLGIATPCYNPQRLEGFIDLYPDISSNEEITTWVKRNFLGTPRR